MKKEKKAQKVHIKFLPLQVKTHIKPIIHPLLITMALSSNSSITSAMAEETKTTTNVQLKPLSPLMARKSYFPSEQSLVSAFSPHRSSIKALQMRFTQELKERRSMPLPLSLYEDPTQCEIEPPTKRRRFERRNSKTAAMLFSSMSSIVASDFEDSSEKTTGSMDNIEDPFEGGLEIAEELVRQLKLRRKTLSQGSA